MQNMKVQSHFRGCGKFATECNEGLKLCVKRKHI